MDIKMTIKSRPPIVPDKCQYCDTPLSPNDWSEHVVSPMMVGDVFTCPKCGKERHVLYPRGSAVVSDIANLNNMGGLKK